MQKASPDYTLLILSISSPLILGVYQNSRLVKRVESDRKSSDILLHLIEEVMDQFPLSRILYTRGPGSYMAIKLTYIILKTIEIVKDIPFYGCSAFAFNGDRPIKAMGNLYFVKEKETIITQKFDEVILQKFALPLSLDGLSIDEVSIPDYVLPAV
ncbi:MAG: hypothetical protein U9R27_10970 [Campylobacterota bacterium]|nr:hypothetical protein [Campylobacterota bacterium]